MTRSRSSGAAGPLVRADLTTPKGRLRPRLHGCGFMPSISRQAIRDFTAEFAALNFHEARTHDQALHNAGQRVIDTHFVFPSPKADPAEPDNYYFAATDHLLRTCLDCGTGIMYRLGTSIEHTRDRHFNALMPRDFDHYAEVLAGIVRHYNRGWAGGFRWGIEYWEVWNEADLGARMWDGTLEDYCRFYGVVAKRLKREFPEIKIGGPALSSLREDRLTMFLAHCRAVEAPLDFLSWHCYTQEVEELLGQPRRGRTLLDAHGFPQTETMINEWHYLRSWDGLHTQFTPASYEQAMTGPGGMFGIDSAVFNLSVVAGWHDTPLDSAHYYGFGDGAWGFTTLFGELNKNYHSMYLLGQMMARFPDRAQTSGDGQTIRLLAGTNADGGYGVLVADYRGGASQIGLDLIGFDPAADLCIYRLDQASDLEEAEPVVDGTRVVLHKQGPGSAAFYVFSGGQSAGA